MDINAKFQKNRFQFITDKQVYNINAIKKRKSYIAVKATRIFSFLVLRKIVMKGLVKSVVGLSIIFYLTALTGLCPVSNRIFCNLGLIMI